MTEKRNFFDNSRGFFLVMHPLLKRGKWLLNKFFSKSIQLNE
ncbi:hypothetical protein ALT721_1980069 [Alteromonas alvinellae]